MAMDNRIIDALVTIRDRYGDGVFYNHIQTRNLLSDLVPALRKETIQIVNFLEMSGYFQLKHSGKTYLVVRAQLVKNFMATYSVNENVAYWVVNVFGTLLGYNEIKTGAQFVREQNRVSLPVAGPVKEKPPALPKPHGLWSDMDAPLPEAPAILPDPTAGLDFTRRISADFHTVAVLPDGSVLSAGLNEDGQCNTFGWRNIVAVSAGTYFTVGLRGDGTVVAAGRNDYGQCNVRHWTDIVEISAGARHTVGLRSDGTVVAAGQNKSGECNVHYWRNIIHVSAGCQCTFGIKKDRRVLVKGRSKEGDLQVSHLSNVLDVQNAASGRAIALLADGTVARVGRENYMQRDFSAVSGIRQISAAPDYFAGLRSDGTVRLLAYFWEDTGIECSADDWRNIEVIAAGRYHILGLQRDGTLKAAMLHPDITLNRGQCNVSNWRLRGPLTKDVTINNAQFIDRRREITV